MKWKIVIAIVVVVLVSALVVAHLVDFSALKKLHGG